MWPAEGRTAVTTAGWCYDILTLFNYRYTPEQRGNPMGPTPLTLGAPRGRHFERPHDQLLGLSPCNHQGQIRTDTHVYQYAALLLLRLHGQAREDYGPEGKGR